MSRCSNVSLSGRGHPAPRRAAGPAPARLAGAQTHRDRGFADLARRFFKAASTVIDTPWDIAVGSDLRHPDVKGPRFVQSAFHRLVVGKLHLAARRDPVLATAFLKVANLEMPPAQLLHPAIVMRVFCGNVGWPRRAAAAASQAAALP
jgi:hypothetical protein